VTAVLLSLAAAVCFGLMPVLVRFAFAAFAASAPAVLGTLVMQASAFVLVALAALAQGGVTLDGILPFVLAGLIAPGVSQIFITLGIRDAGSSRASVAFGMAPLFAVAIAMIFLAERPGAATLIGAVLVVAGGVALAVERDRPEHVRWIGIAFALVGALLFAIRDNLVRHVSLDTEVPALTGAAATIAAAMALTAAVALARGEMRAIPRGVVRWALPGAAVGVAYVAFFEALYRGKVSVVAPILGTESFFGVLFSALLLGSSERITRRLVAGAVLVVAGGVLIGIFR